jgi:hypothetical protein
MHKNASSVAWAFGLSVVIGGTMTAVAEGGDLAPPPRPLSVYGTLPIRFEPNVGQAPAFAKYLARGGRYAIAITEHGAILDLRQPAAPGRFAESGTGAWLGLSLVHANSKPGLRAERPQSSVSNYLIGNDSSKWQSNVPNYAAVRFEEVYPGVDWVLYGNPQQLEYDFAVAPHADPRRIELEIRGARANWSSIRRSSIPRISGVPAVTAPPPSRWIVAVMPMLREPRPRAIFRRKLRFRESMKTRHGEMPSSRN